MIKEPLTSNPSVYYGSVAAFFAVFVVSIFAIPLIGIIYPMPESEAINVMPYSGDIEKIIALITENNELRKEANELSREQSRLLAEQNEVLRRMYGSSIRMHAGKFLPEDAVKELQFLEK